MKKIVSMVSALLLVGSLALAQGKGASPKGGKPPEPTKEQRQKMAEAHEKMAACLKSDKPMSECRDEMKKECKDMMGKGGCPMMGDMDHHHGHDKRHHDMDEKSESSKD